MFCFTMVGVCYGYFQSNFAWALINWAEILWGNLLLKEAG